MKNFMLAGVLAMFVGMSAQAADIVYEPPSVGGTMVLDAGAPDLNVNIIAEILETFKMTVSQADMVAQGPDFGLIDLGRFNVAASVADSACRVEEDPVPLDLDASITCAVDAANEKFDFSVEMGYKIEMSGGFTVDVNISHIADGGKVEFAGQTLSVDGGAAAATALLDEKGNSQGTLQWKGSMPFSGSASSLFGTVIELDVVRNN